jgi:hypothetical protein
LPQFRGQNALDVSLEGAAVDPAVEDEGRDHASRRQAGDESRRFPATAQGMVVFAASGDNDSWRIVNTQDLVPKLRFDFLGYKPIGIEQAYDSTGLVQPNPSCRHAMATYLVLIDRTRQPDPDCRVQTVAAAASVSGRVPAGRVLAEAPVVTPAPTPSKSLEMIDGPSSELTA